jgi:hypothetical protein
MSLRRVALALPLLAAGASCTKVPLHDVYAGFLLSDAAWFAEEETLFVFWHVEAEQGLGDPSVIEISYVTDEVRVDWTPITELDPVHIHEEVDCGVNALCGSHSIHVPIQPRAVSLRLRYHRDGELALDAYTNFNTISGGPPHAARSYVAYGVFDQSNQWVQWRGRHQFPTLRNEQAEEYGLRRQLTISDQVYGTPSSSLATGSNLYGYGGTCPSDFVDAGLVPVQTTARAVFETDTLPIEASPDSTVCATATVTDATGSFEAAAIARKNPEVRPAFPILRSPIRDATRIPFFLAPCERTISEEHETMQRQRLQMNDLPTTCIDDWQAPNFSDALAETFSLAVEAERPEGNDMVLVIGLHQDERGVSEAVEEALVQVAPEERGTASPRLVGAFVFDSDIRGMRLDELDPVTLWCPSKLPDEDDTAFDYSASLTCAVAPDNPDIELGPFSFGTLPILPSRSLYLDFIDTYSEAQAGRITDLSFRAPEFSTTGDHVEIFDYGVATFLDDETINADADDAFSYCVGDEYQLFVFRSLLMQSPKFLKMLAQACAHGGVPEELCAWASLGLLPIEYLPEWHSSMGELGYDLGVFWEFPFLLRAEFEVFTAGSVSAFGLSVPFGLGQNGEAYLGSAMWTADELDLSELLTQCTRFCDHPTFDSAGVYQVQDSFRDSYGSSCYLPRYPLQTDGGFPSDP